MNFLNLFFIASSLFVISSCATRYDGYHIIRVFPTNPSHIELLEELEQTDSNFDIWNAIRMKPARFDVSLPPMSFLKYKALFEAKNISVEILNNNIQNTIDTETREMLQSRAKSSSIIYKYATYSEISDFVDETVAANPDIASSYVAGQTGEGRDIKVIVLNPVKTSTRSLWMDCGIHAREWVSPATCVYAINNFIKEYEENNPETVAIFNKYQIHIMPVVNPDGYVYSHTTTRLWRKNRKINLGSSCIGVDLNRNWGYKWMTGGASSNPCSQVYAGETSDSEPETQAIQKSLKEKQGNWDAYFNVHSYGAWWLLPYGYTYTSIKKPDNYDEMMAMAKIGTDAIQSLYGEKFTAGASSDLLYANSGSSKDWAYGELGIQYSYVLELRPGAGTADYFYGFQLPENRLLQVCPETYAGIKAVFNSLV